MRASPPRIESFAPVARADARLLILGSMPGVASLRVQQYYAHPRNQFWHIMGELVGASPQLPYARRLQRLLQGRVALWDVLKSCVREGSLDTAIDEAEPNDLPGFLRQHSQVVSICCNGSHARRALQRHFGELLATQFPQLTQLRLPSTSPANASWHYARKLAAWRVALDEPETLPASRGG